jgi:hypothetical protein
VSESASEQPHVIVAVLIFNEKGWVFLREAEFLRAPIKGDFLHLTEDRGEITLEVVGVSLPERSDGGECLAQVYCVEIEHVLRRLNDRLFERQASVAAVSQKN